MVANWIGSFSRYVGFFFGECVLRPPCRRGAQRQFVTEAVITANGSLSLRLSQVCAAQSNFPTRQEPPPAPELRLRPGAHSEVHPCVFRKTPTVFFGSVWPRGSWPGFCVWLAGDNQTTEKFSVAKESSHNCWIELVTLPRRTRKGILVW